MSTFKRAYEALAKQNRSDQLLAKHLHIVKHVVGLIAMELPGGMPAEPLESGGLFGLLDAVNQFDPAREVEFPVDARKQIRQSVYATLRREWTLDLETVQPIIDVYSRLLAPVDLSSLAVATALSTEELLDRLIALRLAQRVGSVTETGIDFDTPERRTAEWLAGRLSANDSSFFTSLDTVSARLLTLYIHEDLRLQEISELLRLPQVETKRMYRRALWGIGESLRQPR